MYNYKALAISFIAKDCPVRFKSTFHTLPNPPIPITYSNENELLLIGY